MVGRWFIAAVGLAIWPNPATGQRSKPAREPAKRDTTVVASDRYAAGPMKRWLLGNNYRELWAAPIRVPILDMARYAGGLKGSKLGGGKQTKSLRMEASDGREFVFRPIHKALLVLPDEFRGTVIWDAFRDAFSASHPAAPLIAPPILEAAGVLHVTPVVVVMPDDARLGEFRKDFAGVLGTLEEYPRAHADAPGFAGAVEIIDSDELLMRLNTSARDRVDANALLAARMVDMLLNDNDRHPGQWKWARMGAEHVWIPIPRDRDKALVSYEGLGLQIARRVKPDLVTFDRTYPNLVGLFQNAVEFDRRLLSGVDRETWMAIANRLKAAITDSVIDQALRAMPGEYQRSTPELRMKLRSRRDRLPDAAAGYYRTIFNVVDVHGTDSTERALISRLPDGRVDLRVESGKTVEYSRHFSPGETREIRLYLHGGDDSAIVRGGRGIPIRIVGGNGTNTLIDSVKGSRRRVWLYDEGPTSGVHYQNDTVSRIVYDADSAYNRRPWIRAYGAFRPPGVDHSTMIRPVFGFRGGYGLGVVPLVGVSRYAYGFRTVPYNSMARLEAAYATGTGGWLLGLTTDHRFESSRWHTLDSARVSQIEVTQFRGFGNDAADPGRARSEIRQTEWMLHPAMAFGLSLTSDVSFGPVLKYSVTSDQPGTVIGTDRPYGVDRFGEIGLQFDVGIDTRNNPINATRGGALRLTASIFPEVWDVKNTYTSLSAVATVYRSLPLTKGSVFAVRAGAQKLYGDFPYFDAAFLGGIGSVRTLDQQQLAGDAAIHGTTELRIPLVRFPFILPLHIGAIGFADAGRVYVDGESPGGWHSAAGGGFWLGTLSSSARINVLLTNRAYRRVVLTTGVSF